MSKEAENKRNTPPHSGFAMFFYRIFFAMFGAFKNEINEQDEYYRRAEEQAARAKKTEDVKEAEDAKQEAPVQEAEIKQEAEAVKAEAPVVDHTAEKIKELHKISNQMVDIQNAYCYTTFRNLYPDNQISHIYEHYNMDVRPGQKEGNNNPVMWEAVGTIAAVVSNVKRAGMTEAETQKIVDRMLSGNAIDRDPAFYEMVEKGRDTYRAALQGKDDLERTMGDIFVDASRVLTTYVANGVPIGAKQVFAGRTLKKMMDIIPYMNQNAMTSMKNDLSSDANYNAAFLGAIKIGEIGAKGLHAQYKLVDDKSLGINANKYVEYYKDYKALKAVEYGLAVYKSKLEKGEEIDYPLIQKGIGNTGTQDMVVKELRSMDGNEFKEKAEPYERKAMKESILNNSKSLKTLGKNTYETAAVTFKLTNAPQKTNQVNNTNQIGGGEVAKTIAQAKAQPKIQTK